VHVACSYYHDIAPAQALGLQHVWLDRERTGEPGVAPWAHVHTASDVARAIACIDAQQAGDEAARLAHC
jgi:FMN phosphatase YigB (HAD superfamily)